MHQCVRNGNQNNLNNRRPPWGHCLWKAHAQLSNTFRTNTHFYVPLGRNNRSTLIYIQKWLVNIYRTEWMKGICHIRSRGRHFSPSLPGDRYLKLGSKSDLRAEISGTIVWYDALAPRPEVLRSFSSPYANASGFTFSCRLRFLKYNTFDCFQKLKERRFSRFSKSFYFSFIWCYYFTPFSHWKINNGSSLLK